MSRKIAYSKSEGQFILPSYIIQSGALAGLFVYDGGEMNSPLFFYINFNAKLGNNR